MSLEDALNRNSDLLEKLVSQNDQILGIAKNRQAGAAADDGAKASTGKGKAAAKDKAKEDNESKTSKADLTTALAAWMNEFGKPAADGHPESAARHTALKTVLGKMNIEGGLKGLAEDDQANIDKLYNWLENTAKKADKGHGIGRLVADPEAGGGEEDDLGV